MHTLRRIEQINDSMRDYKIFINNKYCCCIKPKEEIEINLNKDDLILIKIDWCSSNVYKVNKNSGNLIVYSNISDNFIKLFVISIFTSVILTFLLKNILISFIFFIPL
ncbi:hypothetical protein, partial [Microcystis aeruginosa]|uniref:hypothetical protein n=1 Tax=Microcystis aeruginosa TaxID=1126 RepID=UPI000AEBB482